MTGTLIIALYAAVVATAALLLNYFREPAPFFAAESNVVAGSAPGSPTWNLRVVNKGDGVARNVRIKVRRGKKAKWSDHESLIDFARPVKPGESPTVWWHVLLSDDEYAALSNSDERSQWKAKISWQQGPLRLVGTRSMTLSPSEYREPFGPRVH